MPNNTFDGFDRLGRPLLELIQRLTGLETTFVTHIDWAAQQQEVLLALNTSELDVAEGSVVEWSDSMCRLAILSDTEVSSDVPTNFAGSLGAVQLGLRTFFALPIVDGDTTIGTVCGASRRSVDLDPDRIADLRLISEALSFQMAAHLESQALRGRAERAETLALVDALTGLGNRRAFTARFEEELNRSARHDSLLSVLAIDLDAFKGVNDAYGHDGGDKILGIVGDVLRRTGRAEDFAARLGGDEFALLLPNCDCGGAQTVATHVAEEFCKAADRLDMPCTLSIGISSSESSPRLSLLTAADKALYVSKANPRDRTQAWAVCAS